MKTHLTQKYVNLLRADPNNPIWITDDEVKNLKLYVGIGGSKIWYLYFRDAATGKKASKKLGSFDVLTVAEARERAKEVSRRVFRGENVKDEKPAPQITYGDFLRDFYEPWVVAHRRTGRETMQIINSSFGFLLEQPIENFSTLEIEQWRTKRIGEGRKAATINRLMAALKASVNWAVQHEIIKENPFARLVPLRENDSDKKIRYLTPEERTRLNAALDVREERIKRERQNHNKWLAERNMQLMPDFASNVFVDHLKPMVVVSLNTGIHRGSLFQLRWSDVDFREAIITVRPPTEKTGKIVHIPMNDAVLKTLAVWRNRIAVKDSDLVFPSPKTGGEMGNCQSAWEALLKDADIENFRWHDMRHDFASQLVMKGVDLNTVRELMGHADMKMTLRYAHLAPKVKKAAVALLLGEEGSYGSP